MTYRSPLLDLPGAVEAAGADAGVAAHYGNPLREQRLLAQGAALVDLSHRGVVTVSGPDRLGWLNTLSSQLLLQLQPGESSEALLLSVQGRIEYDIRIVDDGETAWLMVESFEAPGLAEWLLKMKFMSRVEIPDATDQWAAVGSTAAVPDLAGRTVWRDPWPQVGAGGFAYTGIEEPAHPGR
ncbi:folate-binding protein, partial [Arthrobacter deserti]|nr:folate-binding protein [Arthrobacter deserti]